MPDTYDETVIRLEPNITAIDQLPLLASIAISLKRIADAIDKRNAWGEVGADALARAITEVMGRR